MQFGGALNYLVECLRLGDTVSASDISRPVVTVP